MAEGYEIYPITYKGVQYVIRLMDMHYGKKMCSFFLYGKKNRPFRGHKRKLVFCFDDCRFINVGTKNKDIWLSSLFEYQLLTNLPQIVKALCLAMDRKLAADEAYARDIAKYKDWDGIVREEDYGIAFLDDDDD